MGIFVFVLKVAVQMVVSNITQGGLRLKLLTYSKLLI